MLNRNLLWIDILFPQFLIALITCLVASFLFSPAFSEESSHNNDITLLGITDENLRLEAVTALGNSQNEEAVKPLIEILQHDTSLSIRLEAITSLSKIPFCESLEALSKATYSNNQIISIWADAMLKKLSQQLSKKH